MSKQIVSVEDWLEVIEQRQMRREVIICEQEEIKGLIGRIKIKKDHIEKMKSELNKIGGSYDDIAITDEELIEGAQALLEWLASPLPPSA